MAIAGMRVLLVITGGIAAYKTLEVIRRLRAAGASVQPVLTEAATAFVTPLSVSTLAEQPARTALFSLTAEARIGHIRMAREADILLVAPASADFLARMATGMANDLASTLVLAATVPVLVAPAMNVRMWQAAPTRHNLALLEDRGVRRVGPNAGDMACGEHGPGRMAEPAEIIAAIQDTIQDTVSAGVTAGAPEAAAAPPPLHGCHALAGRHALVTSGPTHEPLDPVRYLANRSSGRQGHAIARALADLGASVRLVSGPGDQPDPPGIQTVHVETALEMEAACQSALPVDVAVCAAAVADWRPDRAAMDKLKKNSPTPPAIRLVPNPDILAGLGRAGTRRPRLLIGFAAETAPEPAILERLARAKRDRKGCDWILANDVSDGQAIFGGASNRVLLLTGDGDGEAWPRMDKTELAAKLAGRIASALAAG